MDFVEGFGAKVDKYSIICEHKNMFCIRGLDHPLIFNQCLSYLRLSK